MYAKCILNDMTLSAHRDFLQQSRFDENTYLRFQWFLAVENLLFETYFMTLNRPWDEF